jgi:thioredoxin reductase (NADPH)
LRRRYAERFRVIRADSGAAALRTLEALAARGDAVALILTDQRMPGMTGIELLERGADAAPGAKRVLLTAYADTDVAIRAINAVHLDHYLLKPWDPPEQHLYPWPTTCSTTGAPGSVRRVPRRARGLRPLVARCAPDPRLPGAAPGAVPVARRRARSGGAPARRVDPGGDAGAAPRLPLVLIPDGAAGGATALEAPTVDALARRSGSRRARSGRSTTW